MILLKWRTGRINNVLSVSNKNWVWSASKFLILRVLVTALREKCANTEIFQVRFFLTIGLNTERYGVSLPILSKCEKIQTRKNSVFGHFSHSESHVINPAKTFFGLKVSISETCKSIVIYQCIYTKCYPWDYVTMLRDNQLFKALLRFWYSKTL